MLQKRDFRNSIQETELIEMQKVRGRRDRPHGITWAFALAVTMLFVYLATLAIPEKEAEPVGARITRAIQLEPVSAAFVSLGYSAGLGFIHTGKQLSFVYDVADLYKAETTIPVAFEAVRAAQQGRDLHKEIRMRCRTHFANAKVLSRIAQDVAWVLQTGESEEQNNGTQVGDLWDDEAGVTSGGQNYGERGEEP